MAYIQNTFFGNEGWQALGIAIIRQAADDWRAAKYRIMRSGEDLKDDMMTVRECERYIRSGYTEFYTGANGQYVMRELKKEFEKKYA